MDKTTEGVIFSSDHKDSFTKLPEHIKEQLKKDASLKSLIKIVRSQFVVDVKKAIGDPQDPNLPVSMVPTLNKLLTSCDQYLEEGDENLFNHLCDQVIQESAQGWNYMSYWASTEQNLCYSIYWGLKVAVEKHQKHMAMAFGSKNDGSSRPEPNQPSVDEKHNNNNNKRECHNNNNNKPCRLLTWKEKIYAFASSQQAPSKLIVLLVKKAKHIQESLSLTVYENNVISFDRVAYAKENVVRKLYK